MFTRLLVGHDGSSAAGIALRQAIHIGARFHATITVARLASPQLSGAGAGRAGGHWSPGRSWTGEGGSSDDDVFAGLHEELAEAGVTTEVVATGGDPVVALHRLSKDTDAVVLGRGRGAGKRERIGVEIKDLVKTSPVPVIVCGATVSPFDHGAVAFDESETSERALALAARFAGITGAKLEILHASSDAAAGEAVLARAAALLSEHPIRFDTHREIGDVHTALERAITRLGCNALFVGGHRAARRLSVPTHTEAILRATDIPVLVHN